MGDEDQVNGVVIEENGGQQTEAAPEQIEEAPEQTEAAPEQTEAVPVPSEDPENGQTEPTPDQESVVTETEKPVIADPNKNVKTVANILNKVKEDTEMSSEQKIDTLSMLLTKFVAENGV